jgi:hypothetical protein
MFLYFKGSSKPSFLEGQDSHQNITFYTNEMNPILTCIATGDPLPAINWLKDGQVTIKSNKNDIIGK